MNSEFRNLVLTIVLSVIILFGWQFFYEQPRQEKLSAEIAKTMQAENEKLAKESLANYQPAEAPSEKVESKKVLIKNARVDGYISTKGLRFCSVNLLDYKEKDTPDSPPVKLLNENTSSPYFIEFGFISKDGKTEVPDSNAIWTSHENEISPKNPATFTWKNSQNITFIVEISIDENYLFTVRQRVKNNSSHKVEFSSYGRANLTHSLVEQTMSVSFEGATGVFDDNLKEITYGDLLDDGKESFNNIKKGWIALTEKYWMTAIVPDDRFSFTSSFSGYKKNGSDKFQVDFLSEGLEVEPGSEANYQSFIYAGAKELALIDGYEKTENFALFDRAVDFGWFYFITKPIYLLLKFFFNYLGNYGLAIIAITLLIKVLMFPMANKSFKSMNKMKQLQPEVARLKELYGSDQIKLNGEMMSLYKKHNVNPLSGCLPIVIQIPVFFSLYKVIYISIDMRQAPFYGWIKDLSLPDPTSITNLFGLLPYEPLPFLTIGVLPLLMGFSMFIQQKLSPEPADPIQAKVMKFLPLIFLFLFSGFPSGLLLYWTVSNVISIAQQYILLKMAGKNESRK
jgi:YidC/Oxa1 family membrane protein insertase